MSPSTGPSPPSSSRSSSMSGKWDDVAGDYIIEGVILRLCDEIAKLIDQPDFAKHNMSPAMMKLSNALADFRDARWEER